MNHKLYSISNAFGTKHTKQILTPQTSTTTMASVSQNLPRTFYKLAEKWDKKVGMRNYEAPGCWTAVSCDLRDHAYKVASLMSEKLKSMSPELLSSFSPECVKTSSDQVWIYDMRQSDTLPKSPADSQRLYNYVKLLIRSEFVAKDANYLLDHHHIATCFFVWYFTKPNFYFKDKVMKQTTRNGIQRVWTPVFLNKKPKPQTAPVAVYAPRMASTTDAQLPKHQEEQAKLKKDIQALLTSVTQFQTSALEWEDPMVLHLRLSEIIGSSNSGLSIKQNKKLQKIYNDYTTVTTKINKTLAKINKVQRANAKLALTPSNSSTAVVDELGPMPDFPPVLVRQSACDGWYEKPAPPEVDCPGCAENQPNQEAHMGGCMPELYELEEGEEHVPDSWEDL